MKKNVVNVGAFELKSGVVLVSDPCYIINGHKGVWCMGSLPNVRVGKWSALVDYREIRTWGRRIHQMWAIHELLNGKIPARGWKQEEFEVGVDSGQAGIFEHDWIRTDMAVGESDDAFDERHWYGRCCNITCPEDRDKRVRSIPAGIVDGNGFVASSGLGDGGYICHTLKNNDSIVGIKIRFL